MKKKMEYVIGCLTLIEIILVSAIWFEKEWAFYTLNLALMFQILGIVIMIFGKEKRKVCPVCRMKIVIWYRICPNCGYIFAPGCRKEDLTEMIEDELEKEVIEDFDKTDYDMDRAEKIEQDIVNNYLRIQ